MQSALPSSLSGFDHGRIHIRRLHSLLCVGEQIDTSRQRGYDVGLFGRRWQSGFAPMSNWFF